MNYKASYIKFLIVIILLSSTIALSHIIPKGTRYRGSNFISQLELPHVMTDWNGKDVSSTLSINLGDDVYSFLGEFTAYQYAQKNGRSLIFIILDAGNFHFPNRCLTLSGFEVRELEKTVFNASGRTFKAHTIYSEKARKNEKFLTLYWIVIDKKPVPNWVEQKVKQLYYSLFNMKRVGLMVRIDVPIEDGNINDGLILVQQFISDLSQEFSTEQADYIFGRTPL